MRTQGKKEIIRRSALALAALATAAGCDKLRVGKRRGATVVVALVDPSTSTDAAARCGEALVAIRGAVEERRVRRVDVLVLATGNAASGEPELLVPWTTYAPNGELYATPALKARGREEFLERVHSRCRAQLAPTDASPVYEGVARALASIAARCHELQPTKTPCERRVLFVASDLRSTHGTFGQYLRRKTGKKAKPVSAPSQLDTSDVELSVCGVSNTAGADGLSTESVLAAWREVLGDGVTFAPTCEVDPIAEAMKP